MSADYVDVIDTIRMSVNKIPNWLVAASRGIMTKILMVQTSPFRWKLETEKGITIKDDITVQDVQEANNYARSYVSSFLNWTYELKPLPKEKKEKK